MNWVVLGLESLFCSQLSVHVSLQNLPQSSGHLEVEGLKVFPVFDIGLYSEAQSLADSISCNHDNTSFGSFDLEATSR